MSNEKSNESSSPRPTFSGGTKPSMSMSTNNIQRSDFMFDNNRISKTASIKSNTSSKSTDSKKK